VRVRSVWPESGDDVEPWQRHCFDDVTIGSRCTALNDWLLEEQADVREYRRRAVSADEVLVLLRAQNFQYCLL
jgi:hypothetical protein